MKKTLINYLEEYYKLQEHILLCYRPTLKNGWGDRVMFLSPEYDAAKNYNHRSMLQQEIVIEYDNDDKEKNKELARVVADRLSKDKISYSIWDSGNRSYHVHILVNVGNCSNIPLLKNVFIRYYTKGLPIPDLRLCSSGHLIRAEFGVHEKTGKKKRLIFQTPNFPFLNSIKPEVWTAYFNEMRISMQRRLTRQVNNIVEHPGFKWILTSEHFRSADDGRERALFMLIHVLKEQYKDDRDGLIKFLQDWYKYSSGVKLTDHQIKMKVLYHWNRNYTFGEKYLNELLESVGRKDLIQKGDINGKCERYC